MRLARKATPSPYLGGGFVMSPWGSAGAIIHYEMNSILSCILITDAVGRSFVNRYDFQLLEIDFAGLSFLSLRSRGVGKNSPGVRLCAILHSLMSKFRLYRACALCRAAECFY